MIVNMDTEARASLRHLLSAALLFGEGQESDVHKRTLKAFDEWFALVDRMTAEAPDVHGNPLAGAARTPGPHNWVDFGPRERGTVHCTRCKAKALIGGEQDTPCISGVPPCGEAETWQERAKQRHAFERGVSAMRDVAVSVIRARHESGHSCDPWRLVEVIRAAKEPTDPAGVKEDAPPSIDVEAMLIACVPGGSICDPQKVADNIRAYCAAGVPASDPSLDRMEARAIAAALIVWRNATSAEWAAEPRELRAALENASRLLERLAPGVPASEGAQP